MNGYLPFLVVVPGAIIWLTWMTSSHARLIDTLRRRISILESRVNETEARFEIYSEIVINKEDCR